jgi:AcrR family transcriptional regulator
VTENLDRKNAKKDAILSAAVSQVAGEGVSKVTIRTIAREVGGSSGTLYYHFKGGLDEVIINVNSLTIALLDARLEKAACESAGKGVQELFERMALAYLHFAIDHPNRFAALFEHRMESGDPIPDWHLEEHYALFRHVEKPLAAMAGGLQDEDPRTLARTIYSAVHGIVQMGLHGRLIALPVPVIEQQLRAITRILADGLAAMAIPKAA